MPLFKVVAKTSLFHRPDKVCQKFKEVLPGHLEVSYDTTYCSTNGMILSENSPS